MTGRADLPLLERILRETGVDRTPATAAGWPDYVQALAERFLDWLAHLIPTVPGIDHLATRLGPALRVTVGVLALAVFLALLQALIRPWRQRRRQTASASREVLASAPPTADRDREHWRSELERCLTAGDLAGAFSALWWWFACSISAKHVDPAWTSRELLARCGRDDLWPAAAALDRLRYGPDPLTAEGIRGCQHRVAEAVE